MHKAFGTMSSTDAASVSARNSHQSELETEDARSNTSASRQAGVALPQSDGPQSWNDDDNVHEREGTGNRPRPLHVHDDRTQEAQVHSLQSNQPPPRPPVNRPPSVSSGSSHLLHQPHGASLIGPSASTASNGSGGQFRTGYYSQASYNQQQPQPHQNTISLESPLPPMVQRSLGDRSNEKRKNAALEIEVLVKSLQEVNNAGVIHSVIAVLSKDFCTSMNSNYRKGGLVGLAATAIGLMSTHTPQYLDVLLPPVLHCFDDPESRVRYYACESLYNIAKVSRHAILAYFNLIFEGLAKLFADVDVDVKNGANLLDRLIKDIVTEADQFQVDQFLPLLQNYIRRTNPYIRQLIVGWVTFLDSIPDICMLDYLAEFLDGLFNMLSDSNREIRQAADSALSDFLRELSVSVVVECKPIIKILVFQCHNKERLNRLTAVTWIAELIHHPYSGGDALLPFHADILGAILWCISDGEKEIRFVAERTNHQLLTLVKETEAPFQLQPLLESLTTELVGKDDVPTKMACLQWIDMLMEKRKAHMNAYTKDLLPVLLRTLSDPNDSVILLDLQVLSRISLAQRNDRGVVEVTEEAQFQMVLNAILTLFAQDRPLLETRGSLIIRKLCVLLNAKSVYIRMAHTLVSYETRAVDGEPADYETLQFISTMVQSLNLILLTATELHDLRSTLAKSFQPIRRTINCSPTDVGTQEDGENTCAVFSTLFNCWAHNPVSLLSLCLLVGAYDLGFALVKRFSEMTDISVGFLMQIDKLVHLLDGPIFVHLRLQLLDVEMPHHAPLLKSIYGLLACLPQGEAFRLLNERLQTVCNLRDHLGVSDNVNLSKTDDRPPIVASRGLDMTKLLERYDEVREQCKRAEQKVEQMVHSESRQHQHATNVTTHNGSTMSGLGLNSTSNRMSTGGMVSGNSIAGSAHLAEISVALSNQSADVGGSLATRSNAFPSAVHGPLNVLPGSGGNSTTRITVRSNRD